MVVYLKAGNTIREMLKPDVDYYTRKVETEDGKSVKDILNDLGINPGFIAYAYTGGKVKQLDYIPREGENITLQPPVSGG